MALPLLAYSLGWAFPSRIAGIAAGAVLWAMVFAHCTLMLPSRRRFLAIGMSVLFVAATGLYLTRNYQTNHRLFTELYVATLAPPALRVASPVRDEPFHRRSAEPEGHARRPRPRRRRGRRHRR